MTGTAGIANRPEHEDLAFDRLLAQHVLVVISSLLGVVLA